MDNLGLKVPLSFSWWRYLFLLPLIDVAKTLIIKVNELQRSWTQINQNWRKPSSSKVPVRSSEWGTTTSITGKRKPGRPRKNAIPQDTTYTSPETRPRSPSPVLPSLSLQKSPSSKDWDLDKLFETAIQPQIPRYQREIMHGPRTSYIPTSGAVQTKDCHEQRPLQKPESLHDPSTPFVPLPSPDTSPVEPHQEVTSDPFIDTTRTQQDDDAVFEMGPSGMTNTAFNVDQSSLNVRQYDPLRKAWQPRDAWNQNTSTINMPVPAPLDTPPNSPPEENVFKQYNPSTRVFEGPRRQTVTKDKASLDFILIDFPTAPQTRKGKEDGNTREEEQRITSNAMKIIESTEALYNGLKRESLPGGPVDQNIEVSERQTEPEKGNSTESLSDKEIETEPLSTQHSDKTNEPKEQSELQIKADMETQKIDIQSEEQTVKQSECDSADEDSIEEPIPELSQKTQLVLQITELGTSEEDEYNLPPEQAITTSDDQSETSEVQASEMEVEKTDMPSEEEMVNPRTSDIVAEDPVEQSVTELQHTGTETVLDADQQMANVEMEEVKPVPHEMTHEPASSGDDVSDDGPMQMEEVESNVPGPIPSGTTDTSTEMVVEPQLASGEQIFPPSDESIPLEHIENPAPVEDERAENLSQDILPETHAIPEASTRPNPYHQELGTVSEGLPSREVSRVMVPPPPQESPVPSSATLDQTFLVPPVHRTVPHWPIPNYPLPDPSSLTDSVQPAAEESLLTVQSSTGNDGIEKTTEIPLESQIPDFDTAHWPTPNCPVSSSEDEIVSPQNLLQEYLIPDSPVHDSPVSDITTSKDVVPPAEEGFKDLSLSMEQSPENDSIEENDNASQTSTPRSLRFKVRFSESSVDEPPAKRQKFGEPVIYDCIVVRQDFENVLTPSSPSPISHRFDWVNVIDAKGC